MFGDPWPDEWKSLRAEHSYTQLLTALMISNTDIQIMTIGKQHSWATLIIKNFFKDNNENKKSYSVWGKKKNINKSNGWIVSSWRSHFISLCTSIFFYSPSTFHYAINSLYLFLSLSFSPSLLTQSYIQFTSGKVCNILQLISTDLSEEGKYQSQQNAENMAYNKLYFLITGGLT